MRTPTRRAGASARRHPRHALAFWAFAALSASGRAWAAAPALGASPVDAGRVVDLSVGLALVLVAIAAAAWVLRRTLRLPGGGRGPLRIVTALALGARERVVLLEVGDRQLLLGVAPGRIETLHVLDAPVGAAARDVANDDEGFAQRLRSALGRDAGAERGR